MSEFIYNVSVIEKLASRAKAVLEDNLKREKEKEEKAEKEARALFNKFKETLEDVEIKPPYRIRKVYNHPYYFLFQLNSYSIDSFEKGKETYELRKTIFWSEIPSISSSLSKVNTLLECLGREQEEVIVDQETLSIIKKAIKDV